MWSILSGTMVNACTVAGGSTIGLLLAARIPQRYQRIILDCLGLVTITLGVDAAVLVMSATVQKYGAGIPTYGARLAMVSVGSLIIGAVIGTALRLHERLEDFGERLHRRMGGTVAGTAQPGRFAAAFLSASVIFCVGPLTLLGCLENGAFGRPNLLYIKSFLDGFCSMALAASMGPGVVFSILTVLFFQGGLSVLAHYVAGALPDLSLQLMNVVGGMVLLATALMLLEIRKIPVANLLPAVLLPPVIVRLAEHACPGALLTG